MTYHIMAMSYTWWRGDDLPSLPSVPNFRCERVADVPLLAKLHKIETNKIEDRLADANSAYVAFIENEPVGYGWSGANSAGVTSILMRISQRESKMGLIADPHKRLLKIRRPKRNRNFCVC